MTIVFCFVGPPGSGKGYNSTRIYEEYKEIIDLERFSVGDYLRKKQKVDNKGNLSDIEEVISIIDDFLSKKREFYIIDGYPRSLDQADVLLERVNSKIISNLIVVSLIVSDEKLLISRLADRKNCNECGFSFSKKENLICPRCSGNSYTREDDLLEEVIKKRIDLHNLSYDLIKEYFLKNEFQVLEFDVSDEKEVIYQNIEKKLSKFFKK